jgi:hypothetical protein
MAEEFDSGEDLLGVGASWEDEKPDKHGWRIVYRVRDPRTGRDIECRIAAFSRGAGPGWMRMATDAELRLGAPIELEMALLSSKRDPRNPIGCTIARGRVIEQRANHEAGEPAYLAKISIDAVERKEEAA